MANNRKDSASLFEHFAGNLSHLSHFRTLIDFVQGEKCFIVCMCVCMESIEIECERKLFNNKIPNAYNKIYVEKRKKWQEKNVAKIC